MEGSKKNVGKRIVIKVVRFADDPTHQLVLGKTGVITGFVKGRNLYDIKLDKSIPGIGKAWRAVACNVELEPPVQPDIDTAAIEKQARELWECNDVKFDDVLADADFSPSVRGWLRARGWLRVPTGEDD